VPAKIFGKTPGELRPHAEPLEPERIPKISSLSTRPESSPSLIA
jgi:hypothetical protein